MKNRTKNNNPTKIGANCFDRRFMFIVKICCICWMGLSTAKIKAQTVIGSHEASVSGAVLDMKMQSSLNGTENSTKGVAYPRVKLEKIDKLLPMCRPGVSDEEKKAHKGLIVYNVTSSDGFVPGLYIWNGTSWRKINDSFANFPQIEYPLLEGATFLPAKYKLNTPYKGTLKVPYILGNGGEYEEKTFIINSTVSLKLLAGKAMGSGDLVFEVSISPTSSPSISFEIPDNLFGYSNSIPPSPKYSVQIEAGDVDDELKNLEYVKKTVPLDAQTTKDSEVSFGLLKLRYNYSSSKIEYQIGKLMALSYTYKRYGEVKAKKSESMPYRTSELNYGITPFDQSNSKFCGYRYGFVATQNRWQDLYESFRSGNTETGNLEESFEVILTPDARDIGEAVFILHDDANRETYRATFYVYPAIPSKNGVPKTTTGYITIIIEKM